MLVPLVDLSSIRDARAVLQNAHCLIANARAG
jgi:hypothetical protein